MTGARIRGALAGLVAAVAVAVIVPSTAGAVAGTVTTSQFGIGPVAVGQADRLTVAAWAGGRGIGSILAAEHRLGTTTWTRPVVLASGADQVLELDLATNRRGAAVVVWATLGVRTGTVKIHAARRRPDGRWSPSSVLSEFVPTGLNFPTMLTIQTADVDITPDGRALVVYEWADGSVYSRSLPANREVWDAPQTIRAAEPTGLPVLPDVALTLSADGRAVALWQQGSGPSGNRSIGVAERTGGAWSAPATLTGSEGGFYPAVVRTTSGETIAAWTALGLVNWVATRGPTGVWSAPSRVGSGVAPRFHTDGRLIAMSWFSSADVATRALGATAWRISRAPVTPEAATVARDGSLVVIGYTPGDVVAWSRRRSGDARWSALRIESNTRDVAPARSFAQQMVGIAPAPSGPLAITIWAASVQPGRLGMPRGGFALQYVELGPTSGTRTGATPRLSLPRASITTPANAVVSLFPTFERYTGPTRVQVQIRYGSAPWRPLAIETVENQQVVLVRLTQPGTARLRLAYGPGFRLTTNAVPVRILRTRLQRVVAGWQPKAASAVGRDLWVLSGTRTRTSELRLLDARTGRLRRGPVSIKTNPYSLELVSTGTRVLLRDLSGTLSVLEPDSPRLVGATAVLKSGSCTATACTPTTLTIGASTEYPSQGGTVTGPDRRVWGIIFQPGTTYDAVAGRLVEVPPAGPLVDRGSIGTAFESRSAATLIAVDGGVWVRDARSRVLWFGTAGPGARKGVFEVLDGRGRCVAGISLSRGYGRVVRLGQGDTPNGRVVNLGTAYLQDPADGGTGPPVFTVGTRTAWVIAFLEQALVRVPVPGC